MKKKVVMIVGLAIILVAILFAFSMKNQSAKSGFDRDFSDRKAALKNKISLADNYSSIIDVTTASIALSKYKAPYKQLRMSIDLKKSLEYILPLPDDDEKYRAWNTVAFIDDSAYIINGYTSTLYRANLNRNHLTISLLDTRPFYQSAVINDNSYVVMSKIQLDGVNRRKVKKVDQTGKELASYIPEKQSDGYFCTDGTFSYSKDKHLLIYLYYYRGSFICLDTNLTIKYIAKTIDTVTRANIHPEKIQHQMVLSGPPQIVNKRFCIDDDKLYVNSALKADNESLTDFNNANVIDVYNLQNGHYMKSFYLPMIRKQKLTEFRVCNQTVVALYRDDLAVYEMPKF